MKEYTKKILFKSSFLSQVEVITLNKLTSIHKNALTTTHRANFYHIFIFEDCNPKHWIDFKPIQIEPYSVLFVDKGKPNQFDKLLNYKGKVIVFTDNFFLQNDHDALFLSNSYLFNDINDNYLLKTQKEIISKLIKIAQEISNEFENFDKKISPIIQKNLLHNLLLTTEKEKRKQEENTSIITKEEDLKYCQLFKSLLEKHFKENKTVAFYAKQLAITERKLGQATFSVLEKLPKELIKDRCILEAKRLLVYSNDSVKTIAYKLGFKEPTNFIKYFKKHTSETPLEFKDKHLKRK